MNQHHNTYIKRNLGWETGQTDRSWFSRFFRHAARKWSGSELKTPEPARRARGPCQWDP